MKLSSSLVALLLSTASLVHARLGETEAQTQTRYGKPREDLSAPTDKPLLQGGVEKTYEYQGWRVRTGFAGGTCLVMEYAHIPENGQLKPITDPELQAILEAEKGKGRWKEEKIKDQGPVGDLARGIQGALKLRKWERGDGAKAEFGLGLVLKITDRNADEWERRLAREAAKQPAKPGAAKTPPNVPKF